MPRPPAKVTLEDITDPFNELYQGRGVRERSKYTAIRNGKVLDFHLAHLPKEMLEMSMLAGACGPRHAGWALPANRRQ